MKSSLSLTLCGFALLLPVGLVGCGEAQDQEASTPLPPPEELLIGRWKAVLGVIELKGRRFERPLTWDFNKERRTVRVKTDAPAATWAIWSIVEKNGHTITIEFSDREGNRKKRYTATFTGRDTMTVTPLDEAGKPREEPLEFTRVPTKESDAPQADIGAENDLRAIGIAYETYFDKLGKPPSQAEDLQKFLDASVLKRLRSNHYVFLYNVGPGEMFDATSKTILAYDSATPDKGGAVLFGDGTVKTIGAADFQKAPKGRPRAARPK